MGKLLDYKDPCKIRDGRFNEKGVGEGDWAQQLAAEDPTPPQGEAREQHAQGRSRETERAAEICWQGSRSTHKHCIWRDWRSTVKKKTN